MTTLKDISRHLGISVTQVSRALNGHSDVSRETKERVAEAARTLGYTANISARKLKSGRSGIVAMVVAAEEEHEMPDVLLSGVVGLSAEFSRRGMQFVLNVVTEGGDPVEAHLRLRGSGVIDGFLVSNPRPGDARIAQLSSLGVPFVVHGRDRPRPDYAYVDIDNRGLSRALAVHLLALGHRAIAIVEGPPDTCFAQERIAGFREALAASGVDPADAQVLNAEMTEAKGMAAVGALFDGRAAPPTALIAGNTPIAAGIYAALAERGLSVPGDVSVVAHDDGLTRAPADGFAPPLTTTAAPLSDAWAPLADALSARIADPDAPPVQRIIEPDLVLRQSSAPPIHDPKRFG